MKTLHPTKAWILLCLIIVTGAGSEPTPHNGSSPSGVTMHHKKIQDAIKPSGIQIPEHVMANKEVSCISADRNIFEILRQAQESCKGNDMTCSFYIFSNHKYHHIGTLDIDKDKFDALLMKYDNWLLTAEKFNKKDTVPFISDGVIRINGGVDALNSVSNDKIENRAIKDESSPLKDGKTNLNHNAVNTKSLNTKHAEETANSQRRMIKGEEKENSSGSDPRYARRYFEAFLPKDRSQGVPNTVNVNINDRNVLNNPNIYNVNANQKIIANALGNAQSIVNARKNLVVPNKYLNQAQFYAKSKIDDNNSKKEISLDRNVETKHDSHNIEVSTTKHSENSNDEQLNVVHDENSHKLRHMYEDEHKDDDDPNMHPAVHTSIYEGNDFDNTHDFSVHNDEIRKSSSILHLNEPVFEVMTPFKENISESTPYICELPKLSSHLHAKSDYTGSEFDSISNLASEEYSADSVPSFTSQVLVTNAPKIQTFNSQSQPVCVSTLPGYITPISPTDASSSSKFDQSALFSSNQFTSSILPVPPTKSGSKASPYNVGFSWLPSHSHIEELRLPCATKPIIPVKESIVSPAEFSTSVNQETSYLENSISINEGLIPNNQIISEINTVSSPEPSAAALESAAALTSNVCLDSPATPLAITPNLIGRYIPHQQIPSSTFPITFSSSTPFGEPSISKLPCFKEAARFPSIYQIPQSLSTNSNLGFGKPAFDSNIYPYPIIDQKGVKYPSPSYGNGLPYFASPQFVPPYLKSLLPVTSPPSIPKMSVNLLPISLHEGKLYPGQPIPPKSGPISLSPSLPMSPLSPTCYWSKPYALTNNDQSLNVKNVPSYPHKKLPDHPLSINDFSSKASSSIAGATIPYSAKNVYSPPILNSPSYLTPLSSLYSSSQSYFSPSLPISSLPSMPQYSHPQSSIPPSYGRVCPDIQSQVLSSYLKPPFILSAPTNLQQNQQYLPLLDNSLTGASLSTLSANNPIFNQESYLQLDSSQLKPLDSSLIGAHLDTEAVMNEMQGINEESYSELNENLIDLINSDSGTIHSQLAYQNLRTINEELQSNAFIPNLVNLDSSLIGPGIISPTADTENLESKPNRLDSALIYSHQESGRQDINIEDIQRSLSQADLVTKIPMDSTLTGPYIELDSGITPLDSSLIGPELEPGILLPMNYEQLNIVNEALRSKPDISNVVPLDSTLIGPNLESRGPPLINNIHKLPDFDSTLTRRKLESEVTLINKESDQSNLKPLGNTFINPELDQMMALDSTLIGPHIQSENINKPLEETLEPTQLESGNINQELLTDLDYSNSISIDSSIINPNLEPRIPLPQDQREESDTSNYELLDSCMTCAVGSGPSPITYEGIQSMNPISTSELNPSNFAPFEPSPTPSAESNVSNSVSSKSTVVDSELKSESMKIINSSSTSEEIPTNLAPLESIPTGSYLDSGPAPETYEGTKRINEELSTETIFDGNIIVPVNSTPEDSQSDSEILQLTNENIDNHHEELVSTTRNSQLKSQRTHIKSYNGQSVSVSDHDNNVSFDSNLSEAKLESIKDIDTVNQGLSSESNVSNLVPLETAVSSHEEFIVSPVINENLTSIDENPPLKIDVTESLPLESIPTSPLETLESESSVLYIESEENTTLSQGLEKPSIEVTELISDTFPSTLLPPSLEEPVQADLDLKPISQTAELGEAIETVETNSPLLTQPIENVLELPSNSLFVELPSASEDVPLTNSLTPSLAESPSPVASTLFIVPTTEMPEPILVSPSVINESSSSQESSITTDKSIQTVTLSSSKRTFEESITEPTTLNAKTLPLSPRDSFATEAVSPLSDSMPLQQSLESRKLLSSFDFNTVTGLFEEPAPELTSTPIILQSYESTKSLPSNFVDQELYLQSDVLGNRSLLPSLYPSPIYTPNVPPVPSVATQISPVNNILSASPSFQVLPSSIQSLSQTLSSPAETTPYSSTLTSSPLQYVPKTQSIPFADLTNILSPLNRFVPLNSYQNTPLLPLEQLPSLPLYSSPISSKFTPLTALPQYNSYHVPSIAPLNNILSSVSTADSNFNIPCTDSEILSSLNTVSPLDLEVLSPLRPSASVLTQPELLQTLPILQESLLSPVTPISTLYSDVQESLSSSAFASSLSDSISGLKEPSYELISPYSPQLEVVRPVASTIPCISPVSVTPTTIATPVNNIGSPIIPAFKPLVSTPMPKYTSPFPAFTSPYVQQYMPKPPLLKPAITPEIYQEMVEPLSSPDYITLLTNTEFLPSSLLLNRPVSTAAFKPLEASPSTLSMPAQPGQIPPITAGPIGNIIHPCTELSSGPIIKPALPSYSQNLPPYNTVPCLQPGAFAIPSSAVSIQELSTVSPEVMPELLSTLFSPSPTVKPIVNVNPCLETSSSQKVLNLPSSNTQNLPLDVNYRPCLLPADNRPCLPILPELPLPTNDVSPNGNNLPSNYILPTNVNLQPIRSNTLSKIRPSLSNFLQYPQINIPTEYSNIVANEDVLPNLPYTSYIPIDSSISPAFTLNSPLNTNWQIPQTLSNIQNILQNFAGLRPPSNMASQISNSYVPSICNTVPLSTELLKPLTDVNSKSKPCSELFTTLPMSTIDTTSPSLSSTGTIPSIPITPIISASPSDIATSVFDTENKPISLDDIKPFLDKSSFQMLKDMSVLPCIPLSTAPTTAKYVDALINDVKPLAVEETVLPPIVSLAPNQLLPKTVCTSPFTYSDVSEIRNPRPITPLYQNTLPTTLFSHPLSPTTTLPLSNIPKTLPPVNFQPADKEVNVLSALYPCSNNLKVPPPTPCNNLPLLQNIPLQLQNNFFPNSIAKNIRHWPYLPSNAEALVSSSFAEEVESSSDTQWQPSLTMPSSVPFVSSSLTPQGFSYANNLQKPIYSQNIQPNAIPLEPMSELLRPTPASVELPNIPNTISTEDYLPTYLISTAAPTTITPQSCIPIPLSEDTTVLSSLPAKSKPNLDFTKYIPQLMAKPLTFTPNYQSLSVPYSLPILDAAPIKISPAMYSQSNIPRELLPSYFKTTTPQFTTLESEWSEVSNTPSENSNIDAEFEFAEPSLEPISDVDILSLDTDMQMPSFSNESRPLIPTYFKPISFTPILPSTITPFPPTPVLPVYGSPVSVSNIKPVLPTSPLNIPWSPDHSKPLTPFQIPSLPNHFTPPTRVYSRPMPSITPSKLLESQSYPYSPIQLDPLPTNFRQLLPFIENEQLVFPGPKLPLPTQTISAPYTRVVPKTSSNLIPAYSRPYFPSPLSPIVSSNAAPLYPAEITKTPTTNYPYLTIPSNLPTQSYTSPSLPSNLIPISNQNIIPPSSRAPPCSPLSYSSPTTWNIPSQMTNAEPQLLKPIKSFQIPSLLKPITPPMTSQPIYPPTKQFIPCQGLPLNPLSMKIYPSQIPQIPNPELNINLQKYRPYEDTLETIIEQPDLTTSNLIENIYRHSLLPEEITDSLSNKDVTPRDLITYSPMSNLIPTLELKSYPRPSQTPLELSVSNLTPIEPIESKLYSKPYDIVNGTPFLPYLSTSQTLTRPTLSLTEAVPQNIPKYAPVPKTTLPFSSSAQFSPLLNPLLPVPSALVSPSSQLPFTTTPLISNPYKRLPTYFAPHSYPILSSPYSSAPYTDLSNSLKDSKPMKYLSTVPISPIETSQFGNIIPSQIAPRVSPYILPPAHIVNTVTPISLPKSYSPTVSNIPCSYISTSPISTKPKSLIPVSSYNSFVAPITSATETVAFPQSLTRIQSPIPSQYLTPTLPIPRAPISPQYTGELLPVEYLPSSSLKETPIPIQPYTSSPSLTEFRKTLPCYQNQLQTNLPSVTLKPETPTVYQHTIPLSSPFVTADVYKPQSYSNLNTPATRPYTAPTSPSSYPYSLANTLLNTPSYPHTEKHILPQYSPTYILVSTTPISLTSPFTNSILNAQFKPSFSIPTPYFSKSDRTIPNNLQPFDSSYSPELYSSPTYSTAPLKSLSLLKPLTSSILPQKSTIPYESVTPCVISPLLSSTNPLLQSPMLKSLLTPKNIPITDDYIEATTFSETTPSKQYPTVYNIDEYTSLSSQDFTDSSSTETLVPTQQYNLPKSPLIYQYQEPVSNLPCTPLSLTTETVSRPDMLPYITPYRNYPKTQLRTGSEYGLPKQSPSLWYNVLEPSAKTSAETASPIEVSPITTLEPSSSVLLNTDQTEISDSSTTLPYSKNISQLPFVPDQRRQFYPSMYNLNLNYSPMPLSYPLKSLPFLNSPEKTTLVDGTKFISMPSVPPNFAGSSQRSMIPSNTPLSTEIPPVIQPLPITSLPEQLSRTPYNQLNRQIPLNFVPYQDLSFRTQPSRYYTKPQTNRNLFESPSMLAPTSPSNLQIPPLAPINTGSQVSTKPFTGIPTPMSIFSEPTSLTSPLRTIPQLTYPQDWSESPTYTKSLPLEKPLEFIKENAPPLNEYTPIIGPPMQRNNNVYEVSFTKNTAPAELFETGTIIPENEDLKQNIIEEIPWTPEFKHESLSQTKVDTVQTKFNTESQITAPEYSYEYEDTSGVYLDQQKYIKEVFDDVAKSISSFQNKIKVGETSIPNESASVFNNQLPDIQDNLEVFNEVESETTKTPRNLIETFDNIVPKIDLNMDVTEPESVHNFKSLPYTGKIMQPISEIPQYRSINYPNRFSGTVPELSNIQTSIVAPSYLPKIPQYTTFANTIPLTRESPTISILNNDNAEKNSDIYTIPTLNNAPINYQFARLQPNNINKLFGSIPKLNVPYKYYTPSVTNDFKELLEPYAQIKVPNTEFTPQFTAVPVTTNQNKYYEVSSQPTVPRTANENIKYSGYKTYQMPTQYLRNYPQIQGLTIPCQYLPNFVQNTPENRPNSPDASYTFIDPSKPALEFIQQPISIIPSELNQPNLDLNALRLRPEAVASNPVENKPICISNLNVDKDHICSVVNNCICNKNDNELSIPVGDLAIITEETPSEVNTLDTNPSIGLKIWKSNVKIVKAELKLKFNELSVTNFMPIVNDISTHDVEEIRKVIKNYIDEKYGCHIEVNEPYSVDNQYTVIKNVNENATDNKFNLLWPTNNVS